MAVESFKNYERSGRAQVPEELYNKGMQYTNAPLTEGFCKVMVNYDLKDNGNIITPRPGLRNTDLINYNAEYALNYSEVMSLIDGMDYAEENGETYRTFLFINLHTDFFGLHMIAYPIAPEYNASDANISFYLSHQPHYYWPINPISVHGIPITNLRFIIRHIGTFAFNNRYYFFDGTQLRQNKFIPENVNLGGTYDYEAITPRVLKPSEAVMWGYNMLSPNPYMFADTDVGFDTPVQFEGILPYDLNNNLVMSPQINQSINFRCFYRGHAGRTYKVVWDWKDPGASSWTTINTINSIVLSGLNPLTCAFSAPDKNIMMRVTATNTTDNTDVQVMVVGFDFSQHNQKNATNVKQATYDLSTATSMTFWKNRLVLACKNNLFLSEVNDPSYFPYPNNMEPFAENIIHVITYLDNLLVFTTSKLYSITLSMDGLSWTVKCIQGNLTILEQDVHLIQIVKNMVYFKSGNYYYMVVPKASSTTGELTIAPISRPLEPLFDKFQDFTNEVLKTLYDFSDPLTLSYFYNFLDLDDVHNIYGFSVGDATNRRYANIDLLYNTVSRSWRMYVFESQHMVKSFKQDATNRGTFMSLTPIFHPAVNVEIPHIQLLKFDPHNCADSYVAPRQEVRDIIFKNYQLLDTGHRSISPNLKKRFRELQLKLNNLSDKTLRFYTEFFIDGATRKTLYKYTPHQDIDPASSNYGLLTMERELVDPSILPGTTALGADITDYNSWSLDVSQFPITALWKIRIPFSGKGYCPHLVLVSRNEESYELLNNIWVFRQLYSR